jgi:hypothetical protein
LDIFLTEPGIGSIRASLTKYSILTARRVRTSCRNTHKSAARIGNCSFVFPFLGRRPYAFAWGLLVVVIADVVRRKSRAGVVFIVGGPVLAVCLLPTAYSSIRLSFLCQSVGVHIVKMCSSLRRNVRIRHGHRPSPSS